MIHFAVMRVVVSLHNEIYQIYKVKVWNESKN